MTHATRDRVKPISAFTAVERKEVARLRHDGRSPADIAAAFGTTPQTIRKINQLEIFL